MMVERSSKLGCRPSVVLAWRESATIRTGSPWRRGAISTLKSTPETRLTVSITSSTEKPWPGAPARLPGAAARVRAGDIEVAENYVVEIMRATAIAGRAHRVGDDAQLATLAREPREPRD